MRPSDDEIRAVALSFDGSTGFLDPSQKSDGSDVVSSPMEKSAVAKSKAKKSKDKVHEFHESHVSKKKDKKDPSKKDKKVKKDVTSTKKKKS